MKSKFRHPRLLRPLLQQEHARRDACTNPVMRRQRHLIAARSFILEEN
jgi:hypothetical protein